VGEGALRVELDGALAVVTVDHPPLQLVDGAVIGGLFEVLPVLESGDVGAAVFRSADPDLFLMHGDVELLVGTGGPAEPPTEPNVAAAALERLRRVPAVTIGLIDGAARGGGCEVLSALDIRIGTPRTVIGQPEVPMGILPGAGGTVRWPRLVGRSRAIELLTTGRDVGADEALALGWLDHLVPAAELEDRGMALARRIAALPRASVAAVKRVVDASLDGPIDEALLQESAALAQLMAAGTHHEPMRRFLAAGGQTREAELARMHELLDAMLDPDA